MENYQWLFHLLAAVLLATCSSAALPPRNCSTSLALHSSGDCTYPEGNGGVCNSLSAYLKQHNGMVEASDCLDVSLRGGDYTLTDYTTELKYSLVLRGVDGAVIISCQQTDDELTSGSPFWLSRDPADGTGEFFVHLEGISFQKCGRPLQFDAMDYVGISRCNFSEFSSSAVDVFNCQNVQIELSLFHNNSAMLEKEQYRSNSGGLGIAYHTNDTVYFNASNPPWISVTNCTFEANRAQLPEANSQQQINQALNNHFYFGRGGGLGIFLDEFFVDISVDIRQCSFSDNFAESFGGGLYIYIDGNNTRHKFTVSDSNFTGNCARNSSFGGGLQVALLIRNAQSQPSQLDFIGCRFIGNLASFGGGLSVVQVYSQGSGNKISLRDSHFERNGASNVGSAVVFVSLLYVQNRQSSHFYQVSDNVFFDNTSPGGTFSTSFIPQNFTGHNQFRNNTGPGLRFSLCGWTIAGWVGLFLDGMDCCWMGWWSQSVGSQIAVQGNLSFIGNHAESYEGGAVYISAFGQLKLYRNTYIDFVENVGRIGSAIVVDVQRSSQVFSELIFNTQCFLIFENTTIAPDQWEQVKVRFSGNRAAVGPVVYTSHLSLCSWFSASSTSNTSNHIQATFSLANFTEWPVFDYEDNVADSHPRNSRNSSFYFQTEATKVSSLTNHTTAVYPGQRIELGLVGQDQFQNPTYFIARVSDSRDNINSGAFSQTDDDIVNSVNRSVTFEPALIPITPNETLTEVLYRVPTSAQEELREGGNITIIVDTPYNVIDSERLVFNITTALCLPGYGLSPRVEGDNLLTCTCKDSTFYILACSERENAIILRDGLWASSVETPDPHLRVHICPTPFCQCSDENNVACDSLYYHDDPDSNKQCHSLREGTLCGHCVNGTGVGVLRFNCRTCESNNYWALGFLVVGDVLVCVGILVALVKLRYAFPHSMKGLLFYIQTVYYTTTYFPASFWSGRQYMLYLGSGLGLYFPWDFCLSPEMTALESFPPRFVPASIATVVGVAAIISVFYCFEKRAQKRIWHGVWAFILLLYAPLTHTCLSLLNCPSIPPAQGGSPTPRWFLDGEVLCFRDGGHTALGVIAILTLSLLCFLPPTIFFFTIYTHSSQSIKTKNPVVERLYSAVTAGYEDRARWWGAWDLSRRLLLISIIIIFPGRSVSVLYILVAALALHLYVWPYLKLWQNILEALILANYCLLHLLRSTQTVLDDLSSYSSTAVPVSKGRGMANYDSLAQLFSFWYYWPLAMGATAVLVIAVRTLVKCVRLRKASGRSRSILETVAGVTLSYHRYTPGNKPVTVTNVSVD